MPSLISRELTITYAGLTVGDSNRKIEDYEVTKNSTTAVVEFSFVIGGYSSAGAFATACIACETAFRTERGDFVLSNGSTLESLKQSDNTGLDAKPEIIAVRDDASTGRSRRYTVRISFGLPADLISTSGRQDSSVKISYDNSRRRTVTISGIYTALSSNSARTQYEASFGAYATAVLTAIGGNYELAPREVTFNDTDKRCEFQHVYEELIYAQSGAAMDDTSVVGATLVLRRSSPYTGDSPPQNGTVQKIETCEATWAGSIDKDVTQDLKSKWESIKPWVIARIAEKFSSGVACVIDTKPEYDMIQNKITAILSVDVVPKNTLLSFMQTQRLDLDNGSVVLGVFDGKPLAGFEFFGPGECWQEVEERGVYGGTMALDVPEILPPPIPAKLSGCRRSLPKVSAAVTPRRMGEVGYTTDVTDFQRVSRWRLLRDAVGFVSTSGGGAIRQ